MERRNLDRKQHWESVYRDKSAQETSWYQPEPSLSLSMIANTGIRHDAALIDIGGGASLLVDSLLDQRYTDLTVLDISSAALDQARERLGDRADAVNWIEADVTSWIPERQYDLWHDRATFHFLTTARDRQRYLRVMREALAPAGQLIMAAFAPGGPVKCSGLDVVQYDAARLGAELGPDFILEDQEGEVHVTPTDRKQLFNFFRFHRVA